MIEGVTRPFDLEPPQLTAEEIAEAARLYSEGIAEVYQQFSPDNSTVDHLTIDVPLEDDEEVSFNVARGGIITGFASDQLHMWGHDDDGAIVRSDGSTYDTLGSNMPDRERTLPPDASALERLQHLKMRAAEERALAMNQRVYPDEVRKVFALIRSGRLDDDTEFRRIFPESEGW